MLYTYCLKYDAGSAPNPYGGICTLAICKPSIRRTAQCGDWVIGFGAKSTECGDLSGLLVYAMKISKILTMEEYDEYCRTSLQEKIPVWNSADYSRMVGDCIYDFSKGNEPILRESVHDEGNRETDLSGKNVLMSDHFYYFGRKPILLPKVLLPIVHATQGHKSRMNDPYKERFVEWIEGLSQLRNTIIAEPQLKEWILAQNPIECRSRCAVLNKSDDVLDKEIC